MSKKLLGERQIGEVVYTAGQIISDEDFAKSGLSESDVQNVSETAAAAPAQETVAAPADADAEVDAQAAEKKEGEQSSQAGSEADASAGGSEGGASSSEGAGTGEAEAETVEHTLTEQDLADNPDLAEKGHKVGDVVRVPKEQVQA